jgi:hypothetical protein
MLERQHVKIHASGLYRLRQQLVPAAGFHSLRTGSHAQQFTLL